MPELHPLLAARWSPRAFDPVAELTPAEVASLLEAARWAPSSGNSQPWRFVVGVRDDETHKRILTNLSGRNQRWAGDASLLLVGAHAVLGPDGTLLRHAAYDLGQAVAHLSMQAVALGLATHQMGGFDNASLRADLEIPAELEVTVVVAIGRLGSPDGLPPDLRARELELRSRRPVADLVLA
jgi:nitroreductase